MKDTKFKKVEKHAIMVRVDPWVLDRLDELCDEDRRSRSNMVEMLIRRAASLRVFNG